MAVTLAGANSRFCAAVSSVCSCRRNRPPKSSTKNSSRPTPADARRWGVILPGIDMLLSFITVHGPQKYGKTAHPAAPVEPTQPGNGVRYGCHTESVSNASSAFGYTKCVRFRWGVMPHGRRGMHGDQNGCTVMTKRVRMVATCSRVASASGVSRLLPEPWIKPCSTAQAMAVLAQSLTLWLSE